MSGGELFTPDEFAGLRRLLVLASEAQGSGDDSKALDDGIRVLVRLMTARGSDDLWVNLSRPQLEQVQAACAAAPRDGNQFRLAVLDRARQRLAEAVPRSRAEERRGKPFEYWPKLES